MTKFSKNSFYLLPEPLRRGHFLTNYCYNYVNLNGELLADWLPDSGNVRSHFNDDYNEEQHYTRYNGTYAQAYEGWSDEEIDEAFDGNPEAYWNID